MFHLPRLAAAAALLAGAAAAQTSGAPAYPSAFEGYRAFTDQEVQSWKEANETVARIGGWRAYAREAQGGQPAPAADAAAPPGASPAAPAAPRSAEPARRDPHAGHH